MAHGLSRASRTGPAAQPPPAIVPAGIVATATLLALCNSEAKSWVVTVYRSRHFSLLICTLVRVLRSVGMGDVSVLAAVLRPRARGGRGGAVIGVLQR